MEQASGVNKTEKPDSCTVKSQLPRFFSFENCFWFCTGKTTILFALKVGHPIKTIPTIGFNLEEVTVQGVKLTIWDCGGQEKVNKCWCRYQCPCECKAHSNANANANAIAIGIAHQYRCQFQRDSPLAFLLWRTPTTDSKYMEVLLRRHGGADLRRGQSGQRPRGRR